MQKSMVHYIAKGMVDVLFYGGILACCCVPWLTKWWMGIAAFRQPSSSLPFALILISSGLCAVYILYQLKKLFRTLLGGNPFVSENIICFRKMAVAAMLIAIIYVVKCVFWFSIASAIVAVVFLVASLFCLTVKDVFKQAVYYKEEHDFTV